MLSSNGDLGCSTLQYSPPRPPSALCGLCLLFYFANGPSSSLAHCATHHHALRRHRRRTRQTLSSSVNFVFHRTERKQSLYSSRADQSHARPSCCDEPQVATGPSASRLDTFSNLPSLLFCFLCGRLQQYRASQCRTSARLNQLARGLPRGQRPSVPRDGMATTSALIDSSEVTTDMHSRIPQCPPLNVMRWCRELYM